MKRQKDNQKMGNLKDNEIINIIIKLRKEQESGYSKEREKIINNLMKAMQKEYRLSRRQLMKNIETEHKIPVALFSRELGGLEAVTKYMKENLNMRYKEIADTLSRDERTIWTAYRKSIEKEKRPIMIKEKTIEIPLSIFKKGNLTVLEAVITYLVKKGLRFKDVADLIDRDQRNVWTLYSRAIKK